MEIYAQTLNQKIKRPQLEKMQYQWVSTEQEIQAIMNYLKNTIRQFEKIKVLILNCTHSKEKYGVAVLISTDLDCQIF